MCHILTRAHFNKTKLVTNALEVGYHTVSTLFFPLSWTTETKGETSLPFGPFRGNATSKKRITLHYHCDAHVIAHFVKGARGTMFHDRHSVHGSLVIEVHISLIVLPSILVSTHPIEKAANKKFSF